MSTSSAKQKKDKPKKQKASSSNVVPSQDAGRNEGIDQIWAFQPPAGARAISTNAEVDNGEFDWDAVEQDEDIELWVLRVPDNVRPKHLEGLSFDLPSAASSSKKGKDKTARIGALQRKNTSYDIWLLGEGDSPEGDQPPPIGGEEIKSLSCLLPRKSKSGDLYLAPKPITRHIVVSAQPPKATAPGSPSHSTLHENPPRHKYPPELLKHRFVPYGSFDSTQTRSPILNEDVMMMEVDSNVPEEVERGEKKAKKKEGKVENIQIDEPPQEEEKAEKEREKKKTKKRKGADSQEVDVSTKKSKKARTAT